MTVINPNSISGITSITLPSGDGNVLTIHTNDGTERFRIDSSGNVKVGSAATISPDGDVFFTGVCTATTLTGAASGLTGALPAISGANLTNLTAGNLTGALPAISGANLTGIAATDNVRTGILDVAGIATFRNDVNIGAAVTISESGIEATGITTATEFVPTVGQLSHRNLIINGAMQVCQRYALASMNNISGSTHTYHTDRFKGFNSNGGILGLEWQENYPNGHHYSLRIKCVTADTSIDGLTFISHVIEDKNIQHLNYGLSYAKSCTLSFWIKSNLTGTFSIGLMNDTQGSRGFVAEYTINAANTWEKKIITVPGDTSGTWNAGGLRVHWALAIQSDRHASTLNAWQNTSSVLYSSSNQPNFMSSTNNYMNLTGVQFEVGSATPFEHRSYGDELALCQRYYYKHSIVDNIGPYFCQYHATHKFVHDFFPVMMRDVPTSTVTYNTGSPDAYKVTTTHFKSYVSSAYDSSTSIYISAAQYSAEL